MKLPVRKCYHAAKVGFFFLIVVIILTLFEQWRGGKRSANAQTLEEQEYERQIMEDEARIIPGLGEGGVAAHLVGEDKRLGEESEKKLAINVYLSDRISYNRTLKDHRNPACERVVYDAELPSASVILIFHNEPYSVVIRTIWSVVNSARRDREWYKKANFVDRESGRTMKLGYPDQDPSSPFVYLKEIILVDDNSTLPELKGKLSHYVRTRLPPDLIRIVRLPDRQGLMRARIRGARTARGEVLIFLDAHCEGYADWLRPLLQRIRHKRDVAVTPLIDVIDQTTFELQAAPNFQVGGFTFMGHFTWIDVPEREKKRRGSDIAPTWSPTMAGGLFAINRQYFWEVGAYDEQMAGWGGENLEMSFRIWQCGGTLETIPCSRVGHVFRSFHPYGLPANTDTHGINTARMAEVWMDDYAELFYLHRPDLRKNPKIGDVTHRRVLREKLKCKNFQWYLDNVFREKFVPVRDVFGFGRFKNPASGMCVDTLQHEGDTAPLGVYPCHARLEPTQYLALSLRGELRDEERCAEPQYARRSAGDVDATRHVLMVQCHGRQRGQKWRYLDSKQLQHVESGTCLTSGTRAGDWVTVATCHEHPAQIWDIDYSDLNGFRMGDDTLQPSDQEIRLQRLRGQRRISRSLMSVTERDTASRRQQWRRKTKHSKNKFILKMIRKLNGTEDHLEADIYCKHKKLYPNNTFVRDLVKVLNEKNIKVINNGRLFEHNRVRSLTPQELDTIKRDHEAKHARNSDNGLVRVHILRFSERTTEPAIVNAEQQRDVPEHSLEKDGRPTPQTPETTIYTTPDVHKKKKKRKHLKRKKFMKSKTHEHPSENKADSQKERIIIEDFVEMKPKALITETQKRKHSRKHTTSFPEQLTTTQAASEWEDSVRMGPRSSEGSPSDVWTQTMSSTEERQKADKDSPEDWPIETTYFRGGTKKPILTSRSNGARQLPSSDTVNTEVLKETARSRSGTPVKLVMRSNLTFDLDDELFRWRQRQRTADDVAHLLDDLVISNITQAEVRQVDSEENDTVMAIRQSEQESSGSESESET